MGEETEDQGETDSSKVHDPSEGHRPSELTPFFPLAQVSAFIISV